MSTALYSQSQRAVQWQTPLPLISVYLLRLLQTYPGEGEKFPFPCSWAATVFKLTLNSAQAEPTCLVQRKSGLCCQLENQLVSWGNGGGVMEEQHDTNLPGDTPGRAGLLLLWGSGESDWVMACVC